MWNRLDKVTRFALVIGLALWPIFSALFGVHSPAWGSGFYVDVIVVGFFWALAEGLKAVFIPRRF